LPPVVTVSLGFSLVILPFASLQVPVKLLLFPHIQSETLEQWCRAVLKKLKAMESYKKYLPGLLVSVQEQC